MKGIFLELSLSLWYFLMRTRFKEIIFLYTLTFFLAPLRNLHLKLHIFMQHYCNDYSDPSLMEWDR